MDSIVREARFISSSPDLKGCPPPELPEFAFIGRSNVGKSSLINMLTSQKKLAKISTTPGKTKLINHFLINNEWYLVDLPGYGYAKVSKDKRTEFKKSILEYIGKRKTLFCLFVLIDSRLSPQEIDLKFINWLGENEVSIILIFTKTDKITQGELHKNVKEFETRLQENWEELPAKIYSSAVKKTGREEVLTSIFKTLNNGKFKVV
jgi:GTP-binding protein